MGVGVVERKGVRGDNPRDETLFQASGCVPKGAIMNTVKVYMARKHSDFEEVKTLTTYSSPAWTVLILNRSILLDFC